MSRFDRYMLSQLMILFGFFALVLVAVFWVNRAVILFDRLLADGHAASVFLEFSALSLPRVIGMVLPMAAFAATVYVTNRLSAESELTVMRATGYSPWRLARPVVYFGLIVALMMSVLTHELIPRSLIQLKQREAEISGSISARLLREGVFLHPSRGVTFYIRDITQEGELRDVYLSDRRDPTRVVTYTAGNAYILRAEAGPRLVMVDGLAQVLTQPEGRLSTTTFSDFTYDISGLIVERGPPRKRIEHFSTPDLIRDPASAAETARTSLGRAADELHSRFQQPLLALVASLIGFATLLAGGFSRLGSGRQIIAAIFLLVVVKLAESAVTDPVRSDPAFWPLVYVPSVVGIGIACGLLWSAARPFSRPIRPRPSEAAP